MEIWTDHKNLVRILYDHQEGEPKTSPVIKPSNCYVISSIVLWQPLDTKSNDHTSNKSLSQISSGKLTRELNKEPLLN